MPPKFVRNFQASAGVEAEKRALLEDSDDDFFLNGPNVKSERLHGHDKLNSLHGQVDEVVCVMKDNMGKVMMRGERLDDLQDRSESLSSSADMFRNRAKSLQKQMWWKECRMKLLCALLILGLLVIIIVPVIIKYLHNQEHT